MGFRYYMFLNPDCKLFVDFLFVPGKSIHLNSFIRDEFPYLTREFFISEMYNISVGAGATYKKLSAELRYYSKRDLLIMRNGYYYSEYERIALVLGYRIF